MELCFTVVCWFLNSFALQILPKRIQSDTQIVSHTLNMTPSKNPEKVTETHEHLNNKSYLKTIGGPGCVFAVLQFVDTVLDDRGRNRNHRFARELNRIRKDAINTARELGIANEDNQVRTTSSNS